MKNYDRLKEKIRQAQPEKQWEIIDETSGTHCGFEPITLADVMIALSKNKKYIFAIEDSGHILNVTGDPITFNIEWDFTKDFDGQSDEFKDWLCSILGVENGKE